MTTYRELDVSELPKLVRDVNQAVFWAEYVAFAKRFYDDTVVKLECETYGEFNDEGGTDYSVNNVRGIDYNGEEVEPKFASPDEDDNEDEFYEARYELPIADESEYSFVVDLTHEPTRPRVALILDDE